LPVSGARGAGALTAGKTDRGSSPGSWETVLQPQRLSVVQIVIQQAMARRSG
jgi:hypothetical protein